MTYVGYQIFCCLLLIAASVTVTTQKIAAQSLSYPLSLKAAVSGRYLDPVATLGGLPGAETCCDSLGRGTGYGISALLGLTLVEHRNGLSLDVLVGGSYSGMSFTRDDAFGWALVGTGDDATVDSAQARYTTTLDAVALEIRPELVFRPASFHGFGLNAGVATMINLATSGDQREQLIAPANAVYSDTKINERLRASVSPIPDVRLWAAAYGGVSWQGSLSRRLAMQAGLAYELPLTSLIENESGMMSMGKIRLDLGIRLLPAQEYTKELVVDRPAQDAQPKPKWLRGAISVYELRNDGSLVTVGKVRIEETMSKQLYPILPYVFFDEEDGALNANTYVNLTQGQTRRFNETTDFTFDRAASSSRSMITLELYYNILNILGRRMRDEFPTSTVVLQGFNNGRGGERADTVLSRRRAESVKDYLVRVWGVSSARIKTTAGNLSPRAASTSMADERDKEDGFEENRRVEIVPSDPRLLSPVVVSDTLREINVPALRYQLATAGDAQIYRWDVEATHPFMPAGNNQELLHRDGAGVPPEFIDWRPGDSQRQIPKSADPVTASFVINGESALQDSSTSTLPIEFVSIARKRRERLGNLTIDRYRLPLFAYGNDELLVAQADIVNSFIKPDLDASAMIQISAFTDRKGTAASNLTLSQKRADQIKGLLEGASILEAVGFGEGSNSAAPPFPNDTPEGRLYNRTVEVVVLRRAE